MKKNVLSLSIAAMMGEFTRADQADVFPGISMVPLFDQNATLAIRPYLETQKTQGRAVRIRFRGTSHADDLPDFTELLSPGEVWKAAVLDSPSCVPPAFCDMSHLFKEHHHGLSKSP